MHLSLTKLIKTIFCYLIRALFLCPAKKHLVYTKNAKVAGFLCDFMDCQVEELSTPSLDGEFVPQLCTRVGYYLARWSQTQRGFGWAMDSKSNRKY